MHVKKIIFTGSHIRIVYISERNFLNRIHQDYEFGIFGREFREGAYDYLSISLV